MANTEACCLAGKFHWMQQWPECPNSERVSSQQPSLVPILVGFWPLSMRSELWGREQSIRIFLRTIFGSEFSNTSCVPENESQECSDVLLFSFFYSHLTPDFWFSVCCPFSLVTLITVLLSACVRVQLSFPLSCFSEQLSSECIRSAFLLQVPSLSLLPPQSNTGGCSVLWVSSLSLDLCSHTRNFPLMFQSCFTGLWKAQVFSLVKVLHFFTCLPQAVYVLLLLSGAVCVGFIEASTQLFKLILLFGSPVCAPHPLCWAFVLCCETLLYLVTSSG